MTSIPGLSWEMVLTACAREGAGRAFMPTLKAISERDVAVWLLVVLGMEMV